MNADDMRRLLERSLREGGMDDGAGPDAPSIAARVRGSRRRRAAGSAMAGLTSVALVAAVVWQVGGFTNDPNPPATPTTTQSSEEPTDTVEPTDDTTVEPPPVEPTDDPTDDATDDATGEDDTEPADWSDPVFPECGDTFAGLPERTSQLVVTEGPSQPLGTGAGHWLTQVENTGSTGIDGSVAYAHAVIVDSEGVVVANVGSPDEIFWGAEGGIELAVAAGDAVPFEVTGSYHCAEGGLLGAGEYEMYLLLTMDQADANDPERLEQAQGGPFPLVIDEGVQAPPVALGQPEGAVPWQYECGDAWDAPVPGTGFELTVDTPIRSPRDAADDISGGTSHLTLTQPVAGALYQEVIVIQEGRVMTYPWASDSASKYFLSAGSEVELSFGSNLIDCAGNPLPPGEYEVVVVTVLHQWSAEATDGGVAFALAVTDPVDLVLQ
jgi:hypothetical protein